MFPSALLGATNEVASTNSPAKTNAAAHVAQDAKAGKDKPGEETFRADRVLNGEVVRVNAKSKFAVLSFPLAQMPQLYQRLAVFRAGRMVGEVRVSGPQREETIVADLVQGDCDLGDEIRDLPEPPHP